ncbi:MAG: diacylglycerol kinase family protein [Erysipelotrichaceae bacterium]|nr:diacylglycerol kinase family protein [Erysipelotrichaceae bacterium]
MKLLGRFKIKKILQQQGKSSFSESVGHAVDGIEYVANHERNFRIEIFIAIFVTVMSFFLNVSILEWCLLILVIGIILALEMVNTAMERCVDLVTKDYKELAKIAKDVAAGAVLIMSMFSVILGILIFLPKMLELIK